MDQVLFGPRIDRLIEYDIAFFACVGCGVGLSATAVDVVRWAKRPPAQTTRPPQINRFDRSRGRSSRRREPPPSSTLWIGLRTGTRCSPAGVHQKKGVRPGRRALGASPLADESEETNISVTSAINNKQAAGALAEHWPSCVPFLV